MIRTMIAAFLVTGTTLIAPQAHAQTTSQESDDARYSYNRVDDGFLRLDSRTGIVSLCNRRAVGWSCEIVPDDRRAFDNEIARLQGDNAVLKKALLDRGLPLPGNVKADPGGAPNNNQDITLPSHADVERVKTLVGKMWRQLVDMIMNLQKDVLKKT